MAMRLSGLISGMDTETVVQQMMAAHRLKNVKVENKITTTEWKQEKWAALNTKIYSFYTGALSKIRMQGSFAVKKAISSNTSKLDITAGTNAPEGTHLIKVKQLASSQFVTGAKLGTDKNGKEIGMNTKLVDLKLEDGAIKFDASDGTTIHIEHGEKAVNLDVRENTTVGDLLNSLRSAGLNANYDTAQKRFFISSKASGAENSFDITATSSEQTQIRNDIRSFIGYDSLSSADKSKVDGYLNDILKTEDKDAAKTGLLEINNNHVRKQLVDEYMLKEENKTKATDTLMSKLSPEELESMDEDVLQARINDQLKQDAEEEAFDKLTAWENGEQNEFFIAENELVEKLNKYEASPSKPINQAASLALLGLGEVKKGVAYGGPEGSVLVNATDAEIIYNGAKLTGSSNNFSVNGLTLNLKGVTTDDEVITTSVSNNTEAVYDMVKDFVNEYNELLKEMNGAYNADSARGYAPPSDDDRQAMTDDQIEKVEGRIKDSLLRRDDTLGSLINVLRSTLSEGVKVDGKTYSLANFGITAGSYTERGILHINGDEDGTAAGSQNKLMEALMNNPDDVMAVLTKLGENLYDSLMDKMKSNTLSSALTVYNDKEMSKTLDKYKKDLTKLESKLLDIENRYYKQFAAMETAMARMNSQSAALASMLGMNTQNQQ